jgi:hypothetical protein
MTERNAASCRGYGPFLPRTDQDQVGTALYGPSLALAMNRAFALTRLRGFGRFDAACVFPISSLAGKVFTTVSSSLILP